MGAISSPSGLIQEDLSHAAVALPAEPGELRHHDAPPSQQHSSGLSASTPPGTPSIPLVVLFWYLHLYRFLESMYHHGGLHGELPLTAGMKAPCMRTYRISLAIKIRMRRPVTRPLK